MKFYNVSYEGKFTGGIDDKFFNTHGDLIPSEYEGNPDDIIYLYDTEVNSYKYLISSYYNPGSPKDKKEQAIENLKSYFCPLVDNSPNGGIINDYNSHLNMVIPIKSEEEQTLSNLIVKLDTNNITKKTLSQIKEEGQKDDGIEINIKFKENQKVYGKIQSSSPNMISYWKI